jgi:hypothetical protein
VELSPKRDSAEWILRELVGADAQRKLQDVVRSAHEPHDRTGGPLADYTRAELEHRLAAAKAESGADRKRGWRWRERDDQPDDQLALERYPLEYIERHLNKCRMFARLYLRDESLAWAVHDFARVDSWAAEVAARRTGQPAPEYGTGSTLAAFYNGASWWPGHASQRRALSRFFGRPAKFNFDKEPL